MGTNYYIEPKAPCVTCGREFEREHIGKSSAGWCFSLHVDPERGITDLPDWEDRWTKDGAQIVDEYGKKISPEEMRAVILARVWPHKANDDPRWLTENHAVPGPFGLARHAIDGRHCIGHGKATYDLITGDFS